MDIRKSTLWTIVCVFVLTFSISLSARNVSIVRDKTDLDFELLKNNQQNSLQGSSAIYEGKIKVHIIEPDSRWQDNTGVNYDNAHLDYAVLADFTIPEAGIWDTTVLWNGATTDFSDVTVGNIGMAVAVLDNNSVICDADPPSGNWFYAYYADASAMAYPGIAGKNETSETFTHTVYIEEGTATW